MIHPCTELRPVSPEIGLGVFATAPLPKGTILWVQDPLDHLLDPSEVGTLPSPLLEVVQKYSFRNAEGRWVLCWDHARYVNHSFRPNCMITPYDFDVVIEDIPAGAEVRGDYGCLNIIEPFEPFPEPGSARKVVQGDDLDRYHAEWDGQLAAAFARIPAVEQALRPLLEPGLWERVCRMAGGSEPIASLRTCWCRPTSSAGPD